MPNDHGMEPRQPQQGQHRPRSPQQRPNPTAWNSTALPLSTVRRRTDRVQGRNLAIISIIGITLGLLLSISLYIFNLVGLIKPIQKPGDPSMSLQALAVLCDLSNPEAVSLPLNNMQVWLPNISEGRASLEIAQEQYRAVQRIEPRADPRVHNILLISRPLDSQSGNVKTEALLILSINRRTNSARLISFDRTMLANIPDMGFSPLGLAACMGGADVVRETVTDNFRLMINDALVFNIADIAKAVDMLGGIQIRVTPDEETYLRKNQPQLDMSAGLNTMDGETALIYSQIVGVGDRNEQNRRLLRIFEAIQARSANLSILQLKSLAQALLPGLQSDLSPGDRYKMLFDVLLSRSYPLMTWAYSMDDPLESYLQTLMTRQKREAGAAYRVKMLHEFLFGS